MSGTTDKLKGTANEAIGRFKRHLGQVTGSPAMQGRGAILQAKGKGQKALGDIKRIVGRVTAAARWPR